MLTLAQILETVHPTKSQSFFQPVTADVMQRAGQKGWLEVVYFSFDPSVDVTPEAIQHVYTREDLVPASLQVLSLATKKEPSLLEGTQYSLWLEPVKCHVAIQPIYGSVVGELRWIAVIAKSGQSPAQRSSTGWLYAGVRKL